MNAQCENERIRHLRALAKSWRADAERQIPEEYVSRGLEQKYLRGDNHAAGLDEAANDLDGLLDQMEDKTR